MTRDHEDHEELAPEIGRLLELERDRIPDVDGKQEIAIRLSRSLGVPFEALSEISTSPTTPMSWLGAKPLLTLMSTLAVGIASGMAIGVSIAPRITAPMEESTAAPEDAQRRALEAPTSVLDAGTFEAVEPSPPPPPRGPSRTEPTTRSDETFERDRERTLIERARSALARGRYEDALGAIERHRRLYRNSALIEEREALYVQALLGLGRAEEADRALTNFRSRFPHSLFGPALERARASHQAP